MEPVESVVAGIGSAVRMHRQRSGMSMRELAARAGLSQPFLSNIENSRAMPSITTLYRLAAALGVGPQEFLPEAAEQQISVVRRGDGAQAPVGEQPDTAMSRLVAGAPGRLLEAHTYTITPGQSAGDWFEHEGEDLLTVLSGQIEVEFADGRSVVLEQGDTLWHLASLGHRWVHRGEVGTELLLVTAVPPAR